MEAWWGGEMSFVRCIQVEVKQSFAGDALMWMFCTKQGWTPWPN